MLFPEHQEDYTGYRVPLATAGGWSDPAWTEVATIKGRVEPVAPNSELRNHQTFSNVSEVLFTDIENALLFHGGDGIIGADGIQRKIVGEPEIWKSMVPYVMYMLERSQWLIDEI
jgi:hypothetical protein